MSRIAAVFEALRAQGRRALIPYIMAGDPDVNTTPSIMHAMVNAGADLIELGVPFSDPMADGPVIQKAAERALANGTSIAQVLDAVQSFRTLDETTPVVLMGYANPFEHYDRVHGPNTFVARAKTAGVDGVLAVDRPPEECETFATCLKANGLDPIFLLAPTSTDRRIKEVGRIASGYVYCVSLRGVTGAAHLDISALEAMLRRIRPHLKIPVGVGFGIRDGAVARAVGTLADGVVIGSALVQLLQEQTRDNVAREAGRFVARIRAALDAPGTI